MWNYVNSLWFCFTSDCGGGDIFDFVADVNDLSIEHDFRQIVVKTAELLNIDIEGVELGERANRNLRELQAFMDYVSQNERPTNLVYNINKLGRFFELNSYRNFTKETLDIFKIKYSEAFNRILTPIQNEAGEIVGASLRKIDENDAIAPKWIHRPKHLNTRDVLYGLFLIPEEETELIITEGAFDVTNMYQIGCRNCAATLGSHLADEQVDIILSRFTKVIVCFDNDDAGKQGTLKAIEKLKNKVDLYVIDWSLVTDVHDLGEMLNMNVFEAIPKIPYYKYLDKMGV